MYRTTLSLTSELDGGEWSCHAPAALPLGRTQYPLCRKLDGPQGRSGWVCKVTHTHTHTPPGFDPWTVQLVASQCTNYTIPAHTFCNMSRNTVRRYRVCLVQHFKGVVWYKVNCWCKGLKFLGDAGLICDEAPMTTAVLRNLLVRPHCSWRMMLLLETHIYIGFRRSHVTMYSPFYSPGRSAWHGSLGIQGRWRSGS
jgi:hypothetical protein